MLNLQPIGFVTTLITDEQDQDWGEVVSEIHLDTKYTSGLNGLGDFSHAIIIFYLHKASVNLKTDLVRRPQGRIDMPLIGIFAQRAKHRPNPIGVTTVEIVSIQDEVLIVKGLDAIDNTPVLDIKPYFPAFDRANGKTPEWVDELMKNYF